MFKIIKIKHIKTGLILILASMVYGQWVIITELRDTLEAFSDPQGSSSITNINRARRRA